MTTVVCDFCLGTPAPWTYLTDGAPIPAYGPVPEIPDDGMWAACDACHEIIEEGDQEVLTARAVAVLPAGWELVGGGTSFDRTHKHFFAHRIEAMPAADMPDEPDPRAETVETVVLIIDLPATQDDEDES